MSALSVRIVQLAPVRVARAYGFGTAPELEAWHRLETWARPRGYYDDPDAHPTYGFNNPDPTPASPNYGYEILMVVGKDAQAEGNVTLEEFEGGLYAVTRCHGIKQIGQIWRQLVEWREESAYGIGRHQWLEHLLNIEETDMDALVFDLYLPIAET